MLRHLPAALLIASVLWLIAITQRVELLLLLVIALPVAAIALKRWIESLRDPNPPLPRLALDGPGRDPLRYLTVAANVVRVMLLFVLFGMFVGMHGTIIHYKGVNVELAKATSPTKKYNADREDAMIIVIQRDGKVYMSTEQVSADQLTAMISDGLKSGAEKRVYIKADTRARYRLVKDVLDQVRDSGIEHVTFIVQQVKGNSPVDEFSNIFRP